MRLNNFVARERERQQTAIENVCGVLVHARPELRQSVSERLGAIDGVEVHVVSEEGKLVVTVEDAGGIWAGATIESFKEIPGVLSVALVYHHFDTELEGEIVP